MTTMCVCCVCVLCVCVCVCVWGGGGGGDQSLERVEYKRTGESLRDGQRYVWTLHSIDGH